MTTKQDDELLLTPEEILLAFQAIRDATWLLLGSENPIQQASLQRCLKPLDVAIEKMEAQLAKVLKHRLDSPKLEFGLNITEATKKACEEPTLLEALAWICVWESERVVKQARANTQWETCFKVCLKSVLDNYEQKGLDISGLREEKINQLVRQMLGTQAECKIKYYTCELLALIPGIEEAEARLELIRRLTAKCERLRGEAKEAKKQAELDGYAKGFAEGVNKGTVIGEKQEREDSIQCLKNFYEKNKDATASDAISCLEFRQQTAQALEGEQ